MARSPNNLAESIAHPGVELCELSRQVGSPQDYYKGRSSGAVELPDHILLFHRHGTKYLTNLGSPSFHHRHVLIIPLLGSGRMVVNGRAISLEPGRCGLIAPYQFHQFTGFTEELPDWLFITFTWPHGNFADTTVLVPGGGDTFWLDLRQLISEYLAEPENGVSDGRLALRLGLLLRELARADVAQAVRGQHLSGEEDLVMRVHALVTAHIQQPLSIAEMAPRLGLSESHLRAKFRRGMGKSLGDFQREVRLQKAAELLVKSGRTVAETAELCGWECPSAFSRAFTRYWGKPPKRFVSTAQDVRP